MESVADKKNRRGIPSVSPGGCLSPAPQGNLSQTSSRLSESEQGESQGAQPWKQTWLMFSLGVTFCNLL